MTITFLIISGILNIVALFYARWLIQILRAKENDIVELAEIIAQYVAHVKSVHEMEMFYGDQTLSSLIEHGSDLISQIENFDYLILVQEEEQELKQEETE